MWLSQHCNHAYVSLSNGIDYFSDVSLDAIICATFSVPESDLKDITISDLDFDRTDGKHYDASDLKES
jgi:hypothetical protein